MRREELLKEIKYFGGDATDLDLIEVSDNDEEREPRKINQKQLQTDLMSFMKKLDFSSVNFNAIEEDSHESVEESESTVESKPSPKQEKAIKQEQEKIEVKINEKDIPLNKNNGKDKLLIPENSQWYLHNMPTIPKQAKMPSGPALKHSKERATFLWEKEQEVYKKLHKNEFVSNLLKKGTITDKVSALTLLVQESPVHQFQALEQLVTMASKKKREALMAVESIKELFVNAILPARKLVYFVDQNIEYSRVSDEQLILWIFEDSLKALYHKYLSVVEELLKDSLVHVRSKTLICVFELLVSKPEQEKNLLSLLINKLGDLEKKIASKSTYLLSQLLLKHPVMALVVVSEVENFLFRPNMSARARYYAITFLNQIVLDKKEAKVSNKLISIYFRIFEIIVKTMKSQDDIPAKKNRKNRQKKPVSRAELDESRLVSIDAVNSKMMAGLLTGVNRAYPYCQLDSKVFEKNIDTLYVITHIGNFNTSMQALTLIFHVEGDVVSDRFYRVLYDTLFDLRLHESSKTAMYLNLLYRALLKDTSMDRLAAFVKRIVQAGYDAQIPFLCGSLFLLSELLKEKSSLISLVKNPESKLEYDGKKRDPKFANALQSNLWELNIFCKHFHPTVQLYAKTICKGEAIQVPVGATNYDPLLNHTLTRFLERFVYKAPKKVQSLHKGASIMQPRANSSNLLAGGRKKLNVILNDDEGLGEVDLDDAPVDKTEWNDIEKVAPDEIFYYKYFEQNKKKEKKNEIEDEEFDEDEVWKAMSADLPGDPGDSDIDDDDIAGFEAELAAASDEDEEDVAALEAEISGGNDEDTENSQSSDEANYFDDFEHDGNHDEELPESNLEESATLDAVNQNFSDEEDDIPTFLDDEEEEEEKPAKKVSKNKSLVRMRQVASKLGYKGDFFNTNNNGFASAEDFEKLLEDDSGDDALAGKKRKLVGGKSSRTKRKK